MPILPGKAMPNPGGRSMGTWSRNDGRKVTGLFEWTASAPEDFNTFIVEELERIPTDDDVNRPEEVRTLKVEGLFNGADAALVYQCAQQPVNLHDVLVNIGKPSGDDRRALGSIIATQVRSLHVHFQLPHTALRGESFVFFGSLNKPDLANPYVLDWVRPQEPSIYQHPEYEADNLLWFYDVWFLMIVLSEIADWRPVDGAFRDEKELLQKKIDRKHTVTNPDWKGAPTAKIFQYGFGFLDKDSHTLEHLSRRDIKRFFDKLCALLAASEAW